MKTRVFLRDRPSLEGAHYVDWARDVVRVRDMSFGATKTCAMPCDGRSMDDVARELCDEYMIDSDIVFVEIYEGYVIMRSHTILFVSEAVRFNDEMVLREAATGVRMPRFVVDQGLVTKMPLRT